MLIAQSYRDDMYCAYLEELRIVSFFAGLKLEHDGADQAVISAFVEEVVIHHFYGHVLPSSTVAQLFR